MATPKTRVLMSKSSDYFEDQINDLNAIAKASGINRAVLLREGAEYVIKKYRKYLPEKESK